MVWVDHIDERISTSASTERRYRLARWVAWSLGIYLALSIALVIVVRQYGERWWPATVMMFGPRWLWGLPLVLLVPAAFWPGKRRLTLSLSTLSLIVVAKLLLGFCIPWRLWTSHLPGGTTLNPASPPLHLRVMTCNVHDKALDEAALARLIDQAQPDVVAFQEWFGPHVARLGHLSGGRWHVLKEDELRIQSRFPIRHGPVFFDHGWGGGAAAEFFLKTPNGWIPVFVLHLASPHNAISGVVRLTPQGKTKVQDNSWTRGAQAGSIGEYAGRAGNAVLLMGDFNMPVDSELFRQDLSDFTDAFNFAGFGFGWTYFARGTAVRIDHVLAGLAWRCDRCKVGPFVGSPHRPVIADLTLLQNPTVTQP